MAGFFGRSGPVLAALGLSLLLPGPTQAACGFEQCPVLDLDSTGVNVTSAYARFWVATRQTHFDLHGTNGYYRQYSLRFGLKPTRWLYLGAVAPVIELHVPGTTRTGPGNPVLLGTVHVAGGARGWLDLGVQWEVAAGDENIVDTHHELLVYARQTLLRNRRSVDLSLGFRSSLSSDEGKGASGVSAAPPALDPTDGTTRIRFHNGVDHSVRRTSGFVNPHDDQELLWRTEVRVPLARFLVPSVWVDGAHVVEGETKGSDFVAGGLSLSIPVQRHVVLVTGVSGPISSARRYDWSTGLAVFVR